MCDRGASDAGMSMEKKTSTCRGEASMCDKGASDAGMSTEKTHRHADVRLRCAIGVIRMSARLLPLNKHGSFCETTGRTRNPNLFLKSVFAGFVFRDREVETHACLIRCFFYEICLNW